MNIIMGTVQMPRYQYFWSQQLRYPLIADKMLIQRFQKLRRFVNFVDNSTQNDINATDTLFTIKPIIDMVRQQCINVEPEESHSDDEQIIPSKTKQSKIRQYNLKRNKKWDFKNLVRTGNSGMMYNFCLYAGKDEALETEYERLQKCSRVVARLRKHLPEHKSHQLFSNNCFTTLPLLQFLKMKGIHPVGTIRVNRISNYPMLSNKDLEKASRCALDYRSDSNSGLVVEKWADNKIVQLCLNYVGIESMSTIQRWHKAEKSRVPIQFP